MRMFPTLCMLVMFAAWPFAAQAQDNSPFPGDVWIGKWKMTITYDYAGLVINYEEEIGRSGNKYSITFGDGRTVNIFQISKTSLEWRFVQGDHTSTAKYELTGPNSLRGRSKLQAPPGETTGDGVATATIVGERIIVELGSLKDTELQKEIDKVESAIDAVNKELEKTRTNASYPGVDVAPLKQDHKARYEKKKKETEARKEQLDVEEGDERQRKEIASDCSTIDKCRSGVIKSKYKKKKHQLDEFLSNYKDFLDDLLIIEYGDDKSREVLKRLRPRLKTLKRQRAKLEAYHKKLLKEMDKKVEDNAGKEFEESEGLPEDDGTER